MAALGYRRVIFGAYNDRAEGVWYWVDVWLLSCLVDATHGVPGRLGLPYHEIRNEWYDTLQFHRVRRHW